MGIKSPAFLAWMPDPYKLPIAKDTTKIIFLAVGAHFFILLDMVTVLSEYSNDLLKTQN